MALPLRALTPPPARKRRTFLNRDEIVDAAAAILERDGYDGLNMRGIAAELGVQAAALYRYVDSREALDDLLFDRLMAGCAPTLEGRDWRADIRAIAHAWRGRLIERRDATRIALGLVSVGPNVAPIMEATLTTLRRANLADDEVVAAYDAFMLFVHSAASAEASFRAVAARAGGPRYVPMSREAARAFPTIAALADRLFAAPDFDAQFGFGLEALIAAIERRAAG